MSAPERPGETPGREEGRPERLEEIEKLAESFFERYHRGERPSITEYIEKHPELGDAVRDLLPALVLMEELGSEAGRRARAAGTEGEGARDHAAIPMQLGEHRILREVGRGGMGVVYEAVQETLGRRVALKVLPPENMRDEKRLERFLREARAAASLHHSNIVPVFGVGAHEGTHYYAMQFIRGQGLDQVIRELRRLREPPAVTAPPGGDADASGVLLLQGDAGGSTSSGQGTRYHTNAARVALQVAEALAYAHGEGVLHRDVKPSNLLLDAQGIVWVTDFGLAKAEGTEDLTQAGDLVGTLRYMAPERFRGKADARSDVYGLGLTLYELLTLTPAFEASERSDLVRKILEEQPAPPRKVDPLVPRDLETIVLKAIDKDPSGRYPTAAALAADLRRFLTGEPIQARPVSGLERAWRWCRRKPAVAALLASVAVLVTTVAVGSTFAAFKLAERNREAQENLWRAYHEQARALRLSGQPGRRFQALDALRRAAAIRSSPALRDEAAACMVLEDVRVEKEWLEPERKRCVLAFDSRVERFAIDPGDGSPGISIRSVADGSEIRRLVAGPEAAQFLRFSPDDRYLAEAYPQGKEHRIRLWDLGRGAADLLFSAGRSATAHAFSPDSARFAFARAGGEVSVYELATGAEVAGFQAGGEAAALAFHPGGRRLAAATFADGRLRIFDLDGGEPAIFGDLPRRASWVEWSPDGVLLAVTCMDGRTYVFRTRDGRLQAGLEGHQGSVTHCAFSRAGSLLATSAWDSTTRFWDPWTGRLILTTSGSFAGGFSLGDRRLGFNFSHCHWGVWEVAVSGARPMVDRSLAPLNSMDASFSPDGRMLAVAAVEGLGVWDVEARRLAGFAAVGMSRAAIFEPDGRGLVVTGPRGIHRWPVAADVDGGSVRVGPPAPLSSIADCTQAALSRDGRRLIASGGDGARAIVIDLEPGPRQVEIQDHGPAQYVALSPSGRWAAAGTHNGNGVKVWDASTGSIEADLPIQGSAKVLFSSDERWLLVADYGSYRFYEVGSWRPAREVPLDEPRYPPCMARAGEGTPFALMVRHGDVELRDPVKLEPLVRLEVPGELIVNSLVFSPGARRLAACTPKGVLLWDLEAIRKELTDLGLDWKSSAYPPRPEADPGPLDVTIDAGPQAPAMPAVLAEAARAVGLRVRIAKLDRNIQETPDDAGLYADRGYLHQCLGQWQEAIADHERCLALDPAHTVALNNLAWALAMGPPELRRADRAAALAREALARDTLPAQALNTLGAALYRLGRHEEAVERLLEAARRATEPEQPLNFLLLSLCYARLEVRPLAEQYYRRALETLRDHPPADAGVDALRQEAEGLVR